MASTNNKLRHVVKELSDFVIYESSDTWDDYDTSIISSKVMEVICVILNTAGNNVECDDIYYDSYGSNEEYFEYCTQALEFLEKIPTKKQKEVVAPALLRVIESILSREDLSGIPEEDVLDFTNRWKWEVYHAELRKMLGMPFKGIDISSVLEERRRIIEVEKEKTKRLSDGSKIESVSPKRFLDKIYKLNPQLATRIEGLAGGVRTHAGEEVFELDPISIEKKGDAFWCLKNAMERIKRDLGPIWSLDNALEDAQKAMRYWRDRK